MKLCNFNVGLEYPLFLIAGPCVIESETMTIAQKARKLREFEEKRSVIEEKANDILEWSSLFENFVRRLKNKINVLSAGMKKLNLKMYFDYDAYNLDGLMRQENSFSSIDIYPMEYSFVEDQVNSAKIAFTAVINIIFVLYLSMGLF